MKKTSSLAILLLLGLTITPAWGTWLQDGGSLNVDANNAQQPSMAIYNGTPYVAFLDNGSIYEKHWNGAAWVLDGGAVNTFTNWFSPTSLAVNNGTPYIAWWESSFNSVYLKFWNGSTWQQVGGAINDTSSYLSCSLAFIGNTPYIAFCEKVGGYYQTYVKFWNGAAW